MKLGWTVLKVEAEDAQADVAVQVLDQAGAVDLEEKASQWRATGWTEPTPAASGVGTAAQGVDSVLPIIQEQIEVGKRKVTTGGVRVFSRIVETPVTESVELRSEHAQVHRRPVDRPVTASDRNSPTTPTIA